MMTASSGRMGEQRRQVRVRHAAVQPGELRGTHVIRAVHRAIWTPAISRQARAWVSLMLPAPIKCDVRHGRIMHHSVVPLSGSPRSRSSFAVGPTTVGACDAGDGATRAPA